MPCTRVAALALVSFLGAANLRAEAPADFSEQIKPLLAKRCVGCHGPARQKGGLRLDYGGAILKGDAGGPIVVPGKPEDSRLLAAVEGKGEGERMPLNAEPLSAAEIDLLRRWIQSGAAIPPAERSGPAAPRHWAFEPPRRPPLPNLPGVGFNPIDAFLAEGHARLGLKPAPLANRQTLLRRLAFDLTGLPPTPEEIDGFAKDTAPNAYERVVDRLLASPRYGERWARHWLDIWRYSDWYGFGGELRNSQKHLWRWRDWTVEALNEDKPYSRMIEEMLAGDEVAPTDPRTLRATGFLARNYYKFNRNVWVDAAVEHTGKAFLGVTLNCARCHDHMYDPISQEDYYRFRAFFEPHQVRLDGVPQEPDVEKDGLARVYDADLQAPTYLFERGDEKRPVKERPLTPGVPAALDRLGLKIEAVRLPIGAVHPVFEPTAVERLIKAAEAQVSAAQAAGKASLVRAAQARLAALAARISADRARLAEPPAPQAKELARQAHLAVKQAAEAEAEAQATQAAAVLADLEAKPTTEPKAREQALQKLAAAAKAWEAAKSAMAVPGEDYPPAATSYPAVSSGRRLALARWITDVRNPLTARVAVNHVWLRHFGQPLVPSVFDFGMNGQAPTNQPLLDHLAIDFMENGWSFKRLHRLIVTSDAYRRQSSPPAALAEANAKIDPDNKLLWRAEARRLEAEAVRDALLCISGKLDLSMGGPELDAASGMSSFRRSLYYRHAPEKVMTFLEAFDAPSPTECYRRRHTILPQQALALANSPLALQAAEALTAKLEAAAPGTPGEAFAIAAFRHALGREPRPDELRACVECLSRPKEHGCESVERARRAVVHVLLNHHDFVTIR